MTKLLTFQQALKLAQDTTRYLLLGNGFSIGCEPNIFNYHSLYLEAENRIKREMPEAHALFEQLGTKDFESIIKMILHTRQVLPAYLPDEVNILQKLNAHADSLKEILISTIADNHPANPNAILNEKFDACRRFLANFVGHGMKGKIYTLNYDLLLYWTMMHPDTEVDKEPIIYTSDGFGRDEPEANYIVWMNEAHDRSQNVYYLHGALHLFDNGIELEKFTWVNTGIPLVEQTRDALNDDKYPLFVAEGESKQKLIKIKHQPYLYHNYKSFLKTVKEAQNNPKSLFIYGHSLDANDDHFLQKIGKGSISNLFVSIYGDPSNAENKQIIQKAKNLAALREDKTPLSVHFYDAQSANVWGE